jgi:tetratricopeptide (TPR) repeat protein
VLGLAALGAGGFYMYKRHAAQQARAEQIATGIDGARRALAAETPTHWQNAENQAKHVLEIDPTNTQALGLAAEAALGGALDTGINGDAKIRAGRKYLQDGLGAGKMTPEIERAQAISFIASNQPDKAIPRLKTLSDRAPKDGWLSLYLGWAELAAGDADEALKAFDAAVANTKATKIPALYGHGRAKLLLGDIEGARTSFATILETQKDHICAQVQLAATLPPAKSAQREADLKALLETKDVQDKKADPRCVAQAFTQLGDVARTNGRLDIARDDYRKAAALIPTDIGALVGQARVEMRDNKLEVAADLVQKALASNANNPNAQLAAAELNVMQGKLSDAEKAIADLSARKPPLAKLEQVQLGVVKGKLLIAQGKDDEAIDAFAEAAKLAGDLDLTPTMLAVTKLADSAAKAPDPAKQQAYRQRADQLLSALAERAQEDANLSTQLGVAYLQAGDASKAEMFLRRAVNLRDEDPEAKLQLGKALNALGRTDEAIDQVKNAIKLDPKRVDFRLELALTYQNAKRDDEAIKAYDELLALPDVPLIVRANAGRFFVKKGLLDRKPALIEKGAAQAQPILDVEPENAAGLYLKGEGLIVAKKFDEASPALTKATDIDPEAQYLDALGRALEGRIEGDTKFIEGARVAYERAAKTDPKLSHALLGQGHMLVLQRHYEEALKPLIAAKELDGNNSEIQNWIGMAYVGMKGDSKVKATAALWLQAALHKGVPELPLKMRAEAAYQLSQLYKDLGNTASQAENLQLATQLGVECEKQLSFTPPWLTESYYDLGDAYYVLRNPAGQARAWRQFLERKPSPSVRTQTANDALATSLQRY